MRLIPEIAVEPDPHLPSLLKFTDDAAITYDLGLLRETLLPEGEVELPIWLGFGLVIPEEMLRGADGPAVSCAPETPD